MARTPDWSELLDTGLRFTELRRSQARRMARDLVARGQVARDRLEVTVDELVELSRRRRDELMDVIRSEVTRQLNALGLVTSADLASLERRLEQRLGLPAAKKAAAAKASGAKKAAAKTAARKTAARKTGAQKAAARKTAVKKTAGREASTAGSNPSPAGAGASG